MLSSQTPEMHDIRCGPRFRCRGIIWPRLPAPAVTESEVLVARIQIDHGPHLASFRAPLFGRRAVIRWRTSFTHSYHESGTSSSGSSLPLRFQLLDTSPQGHCHAVSGSIFLCRRCRYLFQVTQAQLDVLQLQRLSRQVQDAVRRPDPARCRRIRIQHQGQQDGYGRTCCLL